MKILLVTGSYPPDVCGTADYTARLCETLRHLGVDAEVFYKKRWDLSTVPSLLREIDSLAPDVIHVQYPTTGYGWGLAPQMIGVLRPLIVTLHEASQSHLLRQASLYPFLLRSSHFIFTSSYEREHVERLAPWIRNKSSVIPIGCNVPISTQQTKLLDTVSCFSIIRPDKGLEEVLAMARHLKELGSQIRVRIFGAVMPRWEKYYHDLLAASIELSVEWDVGLTDEALSRSIAQTSLAYLPYPDGASERRSSLIAMLMNGVCVLTSVGLQTPAELSACIIPTGSPEEAARKVMTLSRQPEISSRIASDAVAYAARFSWEEIGSEHIRIYQETLR